MYSDNSCRNWLQEGGALNIIIGGSRSGVRWVRAFGLDVQGGGAESRMREQNVGDTKLSSFLDDSGGAQQDDD